MNYQLFNLEQNSCNKVDERGDKIDDEYFIVSLVAAALF